MPGWLQAFAEHQPVTQVVDGARSLMVGGVLHDSGAVLARPVVVRRPAGRAGAAGACASTARSPERPVRLLLAGAPAQLGQQVGDGDPHLLGGVAVADGDGVVLQRVEVDGDAPRRPDLVLAPVARARCSG